MSSRAIVIGDGVNELVAAHYLARAGHHVTVIRRQACIDDATLESGWVPPQIVRDLELERHGATVQRADPWASVALADGGRLELTQDVARSAEAIRKVSAKDAAKWPEFCERMGRLARLLESLYAAPPPEPLTRALAGYAQLARLGVRLRGLGRQGMEDLLRLIPMPVADLLDDWFESDVLKGVLGAAGVMHLSQGPRSGGTAFVFLHHHVGSPAGVFRPPRSNIRRVLSEMPGVQTRNAEVAQIAVREGAVGGVILKTGEELAAPRVVSGLHVRRTLLELVDPGWLDPQLVRAVRHIRSRGVVAEVTLTLDRDPGFTTLVMAPSLDYLERAYDDAKYGRMSSAPYVEARYVAGESRHRLDVHVQYAPYALRDGVWDEDRASGLARSAIEQLARHVPGMASAIVEQSVRSPRDLEDAEGYPQGQAYHAELALDQALWMRPAPELAQYRTPVRGLYLCGPAMHPGAGISGAAGANAASVILRDVRKRAFQ